MEQETFDFFAKAASATPMMKQYLTIKSEYRDCLLFYRMGDFYEMFFEDAVEASKVLGIALTKRGKHESQDIPMCGVPFHSSETYLHKLIDHGFRVAICEQMETPEEAKKRGYKAVVKRDVVRVVTPGTITEDNLLEAGEANYLCSIVLQDNKYAIAWVDISTGEFAVINTSLKAISADLSRLNPKEILISENLFSNKEFMDKIADWNRQITSHVNSFFEFIRSENRIKTFYNVTTLDSFGDFTKSQICACGSILEYIIITQKGCMPKLSIPKSLKSDRFMSVDHSTRRNLELTINLNGEKNATLFSVINKTKTNLGSRLLHSYLAYPLIDCHAINSRLDLIEFFISNSSIRDNLIESLSRIPDIERSISRLSLGRGGPRDLQTVKLALEESMQIAEILEFSDVDLISQIRNCLSYISGFEQIIEELNSSLKDELPVLVRDGGFIKFGYDSKLDELFSFRDNSKIELQKIKQSYIEKTGINNLKLNYNNILGYFIDITPQHASKMNDEFFIHRQTLSSSIRYTTNELKELENKIINAKDLTLRLELEIFQKLSKEILENAEQISLLSNSIAILDVSTSLAKICEEKQYVRPIVDDSLEFVIEGGRHAVVETIAKEEFIANDCDLNSKQNLWLLTGPNMAGKSTFLRQNAIIAIMAQIGCYVPASYAHIGVIDKVFSRVGAADDLARGRSTFMVEMVETATILNQATNKSLIILDEIGRGTSTYDGVSIAWSSLEYIHNTLNSRAIFATHYHELTKLSSNLSCLKLYSMSVKEWEGRVVFLHKVVEGSIDKSYGIYVAEIAGLPEQVINRAKQILISLEKADNKNIIETPISNSNVIEESALEKRFKEIDLDNLSPRQALDLMYELKKL